MYSKKLLRTYIEQGLHAKGSNHRQLAQELGITHSNLSRALDEDPTHNLTLPQFAVLVKSLDLTGAQVMHILTGKKGEEGAASAVAMLSKQLVSQLLAENGSNKIANRAPKSRSKRSLHKS